ncbi:MAG: glycosyltransferase family 4 protein [Bacilli bacterium]|nr:glycosyltransferase family 4 protein [Bacilli bacterium]
MKILVVCQFYYPENFVITNLCEEFVRLGHDVTVLTGKPNYGYGEIIPEYKKINYQEVNGVKIHRVKLHARKKSRLSIIRNYLSFWRNSKKWVRKTKEQFDIVFSMSLSPVTILSAGNLYKKKHNVKHVAYCVDLWPESVLVTNACRKNGLVYKSLYKWSKSLYNKIDRVIIGSPSFKNYFEDVLGIKSEMPVVVQPSLVESSNELDKVEFGEGFHVLYCGNLGQIQLIDLIPEIMKRAKNDGVIFHVIGMGPRSNDLKNKIKEYDLEDVLIYHGPIIAKKAASYFKASDALYVSLKSDGYVGKTIPNKLVMYEAFAKPIVGVLDGDGKDMLNNIKGNVTCGPDVEEIYNAIITLKNKNPDELNQMGLANKSFYNRELTVNKSASKIIDVLLSELK